MSTGQYVVLQGVMANNTALQKLNSSKTEGLTIAAELQAQQAQQIKKDQAALQDAEHANKQKSYQLAAALRNAVKAEKKAEALEEQNSQLLAAVAERDAIILEWMQSNEAFKRLARQYGKELGVPDEQRQKDFDEHLLDIAEEDPEKFANTAPTAGAKKRMGKIGA